MITEDYVSFEVAKLLKEKGFDGYCFAAYSYEIGDFITVGPIKNSDINTEENNRYMCTCPTLQMAMKWLRDEKNIHIKVHCSGNRNYLVYVQSLVTAFHDFCIESATCSFNSYEEAVEAALKYCLEKLIDKINFDKRVDAYYASKTGYDNYTGD